MSHLLAVDYGSEAPESRSSNISAADAACSMRVLHQPHLVTTGDLLDSYPLSRTNLTSEIDSVTSDPSDSLSGLGFSDNSSIVTQAHHSLPSDTSSIAPNDSQSPDGAPNPGEDSSVDGGTVAGTASTEYVPDGASLTIMASTAAASPRPVGIDGAAAAAAAYKGLPAQLPALAPDSTGVITRTSTHQLPVITAPAAPGGSAAGGNKADGLSASKPTVAPAASANSARSEGGWICAIGRHWGSFRRWFTTYRQLFAMSLAVNVLLLCLAATGHFEWGSMNAGTMATLTFLFAVLTRNEIFMRGVFWTTVHVVHRNFAPLWMRLEAAYILHHIGGVHSGSAIASVMWLAYHISRRLTDSCPTACFTLSTFHGVETILDVVLLDILTLACIGAHPWIRCKHHNTFEISHRALGWTGLVVLWTADAMGRAQHAKNEGVYLIRYILESEGFWIQTVATVLVILPWLCVRKVAVTTTVSPKKDNIVLRFPDQGVGAGLFTRISRSPLLEWHTFAAVALPEGKAAQQHLVIVSGVGDWTKGLIAHPPTHLWTRCFRFADLPYVLKMFKRFTLVGTGAGIAPLVSSLTQVHPDQHINVVWSVKDPSVVLPQEVFDMIMTTRPNQEVRLWNSAVSGRPDLVALTRQAVHDLKSEIVVVISNPRGTCTMLDGCAAAGIPCLGPILDS